MFKAILFDLNGTMINDMEYHINAWYNLLNNLGARLSIEETKLQCYGKKPGVARKNFSWPVF